MSTLLSILHVTVILVSSLLVQFHICFLSHILAKLNQVFEASVMKVIIANGLFPV